MLRLVKNARPNVPFERPAVFFANRLGDQLIALPAMRALGAIFPGGMQLLLGEGMPSFFHQHLPFSEPVRVRWDGDDERRIAVARTARAAACCDLFLCLSPAPLWFVGPLARRLGSCRTVGYGEGLDHELRFADGIHAFDSVFAIPQCLAPALRLDEFCGPPVFSAAAEAAAARFLASARGPWPRVLFVHPETGPERMWARERLAWVLDRFLAERPDFMAFVSSLAPVDLDSHGGRVRQIDMHLELTLALMRHADLFLGVDSCFLHAADLYRIPGVALFGPTEAWQWGFRLSPRSRHVSARTMDEIRCEPVIEALLDVAEAVPVGPDACFDPTR